MNFRTFDLNLLRIFDAVMSEGSLTRAAQGLAMTQPAVSQSLRRLRDAVGDELFVREAYGVRPTAVAEAMWPRVRAALAELRQVLAPEGFDPSRDEVQFRLAMADATAALLAPPLVALIEQQQARVNLRVLPLTTRDPRKLVQNGEADLAVGYFPELVTAILAQGQDSPLRQAKLYESRYVCVMRKGHPLAEQVLTLDDYCAAHHLLVSFSGRPHGLVDQALAALQRQRRIVLTVNQFFAAGRVVARSNLITVLPEGFVEATGYGHELVKRELPLSLQPVQVVMVWHLRHDAEPAHQWLRQRLLEAAQT